MFITVTIAIHFVKTQVHKEVIKKLATHARPKKLTVA